MEKAFIGELKNIVKALGDRSLKVETYDNPLAGRTEVYIKRSGQYICSLNLKGNKVTLWVQAPGNEAVVKDVASKLREKGFEVEVIK